MTPDATDWDNYYKRPARFAFVTRRISAAKILRTLAPRLATPGVRICELGGANSSFIDDFLAIPNVGSYHVIDLNAYGIDLLNQRFPNDPRVSAEVADVLTKASHADTYDIVYSVGLVEHFDPIDTARCIGAHFRLMRSGGAVLITFPTPTVPYRLIRGAAELSGMWAFPDERPLTFDEVASCCSRYGRIDHESINWSIGLTQGYILTSSFESQA